MTNEILNNAQYNRHDEFFTQYDDVEKELQHYTKHFANKIVYLNCDNPTTSNFWRYFYCSFNHLKLKKLIATYYETTGKPSYAFIYQGGRNNTMPFDQGIKQVPLTGNGDFRSSECISYLKQADIVVTNPPFSFLCLNLTRFGLVVLPTRPVFFASLMNTRNGTKKKLKSVAMVITMPKCLQSVCLPICH